MSSYKINIIYFQYIVAQSKHSYSKRESQGIGRVRSKQNLSPAGGILRPEVLCPASGALAVPLWAGTQPPPPPRSAPPHTHSLPWQISWSWHLNILGSPLPLSLHLHRSSSGLSGSLCWDSNSTVNSLHEPSSLYLCLQRMLCHMDNTAKFCCQVEV